MCVLGRMHVSKMAFRFWFFAQKTTKDTTAACELWISSLGEKDIQEFPSNLSYTQRTKSFQKRSQSESGCGRPGFWRFAWSPHVSSLEATPLRTSQRQFLSEAQHKLLLQVRLAQPVPEPQSIRVPAFLGAGLGDAIPVSQPNKSICKQNHCPGPWAKLKQKKITARNTETTRKEGPVRFIDFDALQFASKRVKSSSESSGCSWKVRVRGGWDPPFQMPPGQLLCARTSNSWKEQKPANLSNSIMGEFSQLEWETRD